MRARPQLHPTVDGWMNDPIGPVLWGAAWHVFHQYNPGQSVWGPMRWGHLVSDDLLHWRHEGIAMRPNVDGPDAEGCWSGCIRIIDGHPVAFYTGFSQAGQSQLRAVAEPGLAGFRLEPEEPIVPPADPSLGTTDQRDPYLLRWKDHWIMLLGTGSVDGSGGALVAWTSLDTRTWTYQGVVFSRPAGSGKIDTGPVWECPQLVEVDGHWVLLISVQFAGDPQPRCAYVVWFVGDFDGRVFTPESEGLLDAGDVLYASAVSEHADGRALVWSWLQEPLRLRGRDDLGWAGAQALPRELAVRNSRVWSRPAREVDQAWRRPLLQQAGSAPGEAPRVFDIGTGPYRVRLEFEAPGWRLDLGGTLRVALKGVTADAGTLRVAATVDGRPAGDLQLPAGTNVLDVYVDGPVVEVFSFGLALTLRTDPVPTGPVRLTLDVAPSSLVSSFEVLLPPERSESN